LPPRRVSGAEIDNLPFWTGYTVVTRVLKPDSRFREVEKGKFAAKTA
jgi:hypothetical protein